MWNLLSHPLTHVMGGWGVGGGKWEGCKKKWCSSYRWGSGAWKDSSSSSHCLPPPNRLRVFKVNKLQPYFSRLREALNGAGGGGWNFSHSGVHVYEFKNELMQGSWENYSPHPMNMDIRNRRISSHCPHYTHMWQIGQGPAGYRAPLLPWIGAFRVFGSSLLDHEPTEQQPGLSYVVPIQCPSQCQCFINMCGLKLAWDRHFAWRQLVHDTGMQTGRHGHIPWEGSRSQMLPCGPVLTLLHTLVPFLEMKSILGNSLLSYRLKMCLKVKWQIHMLKRSGFRFSRLYIPYQEH